jgi:hypothetical protein
METSNTVGFALSVIALATVNLAGCSGDGGPAQSGAGGGLTTGLGGSASLGGSSQGGGSPAAGRGGGTAGGGASGGIGTGNGGAGGTNVGGSNGGGAASDSGAPAGDAGPLDGLNIDGKCFPVCASAVTDPDGDGYGYENQQSCVVAGSVPSRGRAPCATGIVRPTAGDGIQAGGVCYPLCSSDPALTQNVDPQGYGYDVLFQTTCVVPNSVAALMGTPCRTGLTRPPVPTPGNGFFVGGVCYPRCMTPAGDTDGDGWSFENEVCIVAGSTPAQMALSCAPMQTPPPPPPPGTGWNADYTATMFGQANCTPLGFTTDTTNINQSACVSRQAVTLNDDNRTYFGAPGDLSTLWGNGAPCTCPGGQATCVPACNGQPDCAMCVEVACNAGGTHSFMNTGDTHNRFCRAGQSVVVQIIDACPHNHVNNTYWCTSARPNHIDISCSAFQQITQGAAVGTIGYVNAYVRPVDCSVGLGPKTL